MRLATTHQLPPPSRAAATCAWCLREFTTLLELLDHVDSHHLDDDARDARAAA